jgi:DNA mismatch repair protein MutL
MPEESSSASASPEPEGQMQLFDEQFLTPEAEKSHRIIGQVFDTYWLIQYGENLYIIDQHAAHEKVLFERMMKNYREKNVTSQMVSPPLIVSLTPQEADLVTRYMDVFQSFGYEISPFGGKDYAINAVPHNLYGIATEELFIEILDNLEEVREKPLEILKDRLATMSCKAAVKGNNHLSYAEAEQLIAELLTLEDPYHCPHGRPTIISLSKRELEKKFKRIV